MSNMWKLSLPGIEELAGDCNYGVTWEAVKEKGTPPGKISHHKAVVFNNKVLIFGGMSGINEIQDIYEFDVNKEHWSKCKQSADIPPPRDDHAMGRIDND